MRAGKVERTTSETTIVVELRLDGAGGREISTGVGFFDHMLEQFARHSGMSLSVSADGDRHVDDHHTVEDVGIAVGQALRQALGDKRGIVRYGASLLPMDETLTRAAVDISGRPFLVFTAPFRSATIGAFDSQLVEEFWRAFAMNAGITLHLETLRGVNDHHIAESGFKAVARALRMAVAIDPDAGDLVPSTKGRLGD